nr:hypothetical protein [Tanacetum cinerariifolium]
MSFSKRLGKNTPQCYTKPLDSLKNWNNRFFWVDECVFPTVVDWRTNASKDGMPANGTYFVEAVRALDTHRTPIKKQPKMLSCLVDTQLIRNGPIQFDTCPKSDKGEDREPPRAPHEVPLLTLTATWVIEMDEPAAATDSSGVPSAVEKSPLDFAHDRLRMYLLLLPLRGHDGIDASAPPKLLRRDHADRSSGSSHGGKSLAAMKLCMAYNIFVSKGAPADVSDPDPLSFADAPSHHPTLWDHSRLHKGIVIINGDSLVPEPPTVGTVVPLKTEAQKLARKNELKAKSELRQFPTPIFVSEVLQYEKPSFFVCNSDNLYQDQDIPSLDSENELDAGQIYFILPKTMLARRLSASDMASLAVKASLALDSNSNSNYSHVKKKKKINNARISPMVLMETSQINVVVEEEENKQNYKNGGLRMSKSRSTRSRKARLAARSFRLKLSTIYEDN